MLQAAIGPHPEIEVDHEIARFQLRQRAEDLFLAHLRQPPAFEPFAEYFLLGNDHEPFILQPEPAGQRADQQIHLAVAAAPLRRKIPVSHVEWECVRGEEFVETLGLVPLVANDHHPPLLGKACRQPFHERFENLLPVGGWLDLHIDGRFRGEAQRRNPFPCHQLQRRDVDAPSPVEE